MSAKKSGPALSMRLDIASEIRLVDAVHSAVEAAGKLAGFDPDEALNLGLAVREGVINAIKHGNGADPRRRVGIELEGHDDGVRIRILDEGPGFDPAAAPDPTAEENLLTPEGRGLLMMRAFVDDVEFDRREGRGMELVLTKRRQDGGKPG